VPPEQTPPEQMPHELTTDEAMFKAFGPPLDEDNEENEGVRPMRRRTGVSTRMGPSTGSYF
jgi:hypothetical protein